MKRGSIMKEFSGEIRPVALQFDTISYVSASSSLFICHCHHGDTKAFYCCSCPISLNAGRKVIFRPKHEPLAKHSAKLVKNKM